MKTSSARFRRQNSLSILGVLSIFSIVAISGDEVHAAAKTRAPSKNNHVEARAEAVKQIVAPIDTTQDKK